jgi:ATP-dependent Lhr-like helicase
VKNELDRPFAGFHPAIEQWFTTNVGEPTRAQRLGWQAIRQGRHTLIAAPTGSGKTLAAFLIALDELLCEGLGGQLDDEVRVVYVSPLKALSTDIHRNLSQPRAAICATAAKMGLLAPAITAAVRTGDTTASARAAMLRRPPHLLVTTPESLYLLLTSAASRDRLRRVRTLIVDEIHATIGTRRGAHLALSIERLASLCDRPPQRIGLSATQRPVEEVARFLVGTPNVGADGRADCAVIDEGHRRHLELAIEVPGSPLEAVMSHEVWEEYYDRLARAIGEHRTTLVFANTRRMVERVTRQLAERLGEDQVAAHHGSLSKERRLDAETRLKLGQVKAVVATASLELGIDIGHVDLVCQIGSPHRIATLLQRVGRAGHTIHGTPKGRLFPVTRDDLVECAALLWSVQQGELDRLVSHDTPLDVLAQQIVAETSSRDWHDEGLFDLIRRAWPYRALSRADFDAVLRMLASGFTTRRGRRGALVHRDEVQGRVIGRRAARLTALTSGGAIPDNADYRVVLEPDEMFLGTINEDFAIESTAGDVFQLGNSSWRILQVGSGVVRVADARGAPPTLPFWLGEAPARSDELSAAVSQLRQEVEERLAAEVLTDGARSNGDEPDESGARQRRVARAAEWLAGDTGLSPAAAEQIVGYLADSLHLLGALPTRETIVLERFFDESGGMQLVLHAPFGSRVNRAWALALRKRFCRQFNFELQAAATEDALLLSLGPQHAFPLADVFRYLHPATVRDVLVQALLDAPVFQTRWRWNATISLAVPRARGGRKVPSPLQRMQADDLLAAAFPDAAACLENIPGDRQVPDHPLVNQTVRDCLEEAMDLPQLEQILERIHSGALRCMARDTPEPSPLSHEILNARPYAFLDDAPLEERRAHAVQTRRATDPSSAAALGALDSAAIERVVSEAWPDSRDADELHDALVSAGFFTSTEVSLDERWIAWLETLAASSRAARATAPRLSDALWIAAERVPEMLAVHPDAVLSPFIVAPAGRAAAVWTREAAIAELLRGRLTVAGPVTPEALGSPLGLAPADVRMALAALEGEGVVLRGSFRPGARGEEWCDRRLLARIHRYTLDRLRAEIEPVTPATFMRFLLSWQHADAASQLSGLDGVRAIVGQLDGFELAAGAWERHVLPLRVKGYEPSTLDGLCFSGEVAWAKLSGAQRVSSGRPKPMRATPISIFLREHADVWRALERADEPAFPALALGTDAAAIASLLETRGALFVHEMVAALALAPDAVQSGLAELVASGLVSSDGFGGLRTMVAPASPAPRPPTRFHARLRMGVSAAAGGRWSSLRSGAPEGGDRDALVETLALTLLRRYGIVFRRLLTREPVRASWRELVRVFRALEARGEIRGGRFVSGMSGEQFALPEAVERVREIRRTQASGELITISGADPLNLAGIVTGDERVPASSSNRIVFRDGAPIAIREGGRVRLLATLDEATAARVSALLAPPVVRSRHLTSGA